MPDTPISPISPPEKDGKMWIEPDMGLLSHTIKNFYYGTSNGYIVLLTYDLINQDKKPTLTVTRIDGFLDLKQYDTLISFSNSTDEAIESKNEQSVFIIDDLSEANEFVDRAKSLPKAKEKLGENDLWLIGIYPPMVFQ